MISFSSATRIQARSFWQRIIQLLWEQGGTAAQKSGQTAAQKRRLPDCGGAPRGRSAARNHQPDPNCGAVCISLEPDAQSRFRPDRYLAVAFNVEQHFAIDRPGVGRLVGEPRRELPERARSVETREAAG